MLRVSETDDGRTTRRESHVASYRQLSRTFHDLQQITDQVFESISQKTAEERDKLSEISTRIQIAKAKIDKISNSEKEITIISPAQHPSANTKPDDFKPLFEYKNEEQNLGFPIAKLSINGGLKREFGTDGTLELFQFFSEENIKYPLKENDFEDASLEKLFHKASLLNENNTTSYNFKEELPPPPPSLCPTNFASPSKSDITLH